VGIETRERKTTDDGFKSSEYELACIKQTNKMAWNTKVIDTFLTILSMKNNNNHFDNIISDFFFLYGGEKKKRSKNSFSYQ
jgi:hypothetical protein